MKSILNLFHNTTAANVVTCIVEAVALAVVVVILITDHAHAQSGTIYAPQQAQAAGDVVPAQVIQVSLREVEASGQARATGAALGGLLGLALATRSGATQNRFAVNSVGAALGGLVGERATTMVATARAQEIIVQMLGQNPRVVVIVQPAPYDPVTAGDSVYVTMINGTYRVIRRGTL